MPSARRFTARRYVSQGVGIGIASEMAMDSSRDAGLVIVEGSRALFEPSITKVAVQKGALLHAFAYRFVEILAPHLKAKSLRDSALSRLSLREAKPASKDSYSVPAFSKT